MKLDWRALEAAFGSTSGEAHAWLDRQTGLVVDRRPGPTTRGRDLGPLPEVTTAAERERYLPIPGVDQSEFYGWMSSFAMTVVDAAARGSLNQALQGLTGSAGRFQRALQRDPESHACWSRFLEQRLHRAIDAWLERSGIPADPPPPWSGSVSGPAPEDGPPLPLAGDTAAGAPALALSRSTATGPLDEERRNRIVARLETVPLARLLGMRLLRLEPGECDLGLDDRRDLDGIFASLHGGILATLADSAFAFAALTLIEPEEVVTTVELNIRFLAPCREAVAARSRVVKAGRTLVSGQVELVGLGSGTTFAISGMTYMRLGSRPS